MTLQDISKQYDSDILILQKFIANGLLDQDTYDVCKDCFNEKAVQRFASCICLYSLGLDIPAIKEFITLELSPNDTRKARIKLLTRYRQQHLRTIHQNKKVLDCINCILQEIHAN